MRTLINTHFYLLLSLWMWAIALIGFTPGYFAPMIAGTADKPTAVHIHVLVYIGWLLLFSVQAALPALGKTRLHRTLGPLAAGYGLLVIAAGLYVTFSRFIDWSGELPVEAFSERFLFPLTDMVVFALLFGLAVHYRRTPNMHKRLMVLAGTMLLVAAVARMRQNFEAFGPQYFYLVWLSPPLLGMARDWLTERKVYLAYALGIPFLFIVSLRAMFAQSAWWLDTMRWLVSELPA